MNELVIGLITTLAGVIFEEILQVLKQAIKKWVSNKHTKRKKKS